jgi:RNA recognition motif-containing protein
MNIYVGNMAYEVTEDDLRSAFGSFGQVDSVKIITDKYSGQSKGFGFVEMSSAEEGRAAIEALNGKEMKGRTLKVNEARTRSEGGGRGGGGRGFGKGRGGSGGGRGFGKGPGAGGAGRGGGRRY